MPEELETQTQEQETQEQTQETTETQEQTTETQETQETEEQTQETTPQTIEKDGVKYTLDEEGNYCIGDIKVLDHKGVPYYNRTREVERKQKEAINDYEQKLRGYEESFQQELAKIQNAQQGLKDDEIDPETEMTGRQLRALEGKIKKEIQDNLSKIQIEAAQERAKINIESQRYKLEQDPEYKDFFQNPELVEELEERLNERNLSLDSALMPGIVETAVWMIIGKHRKSFMKSATEKGKKSALQQRKIVGEIETLPVGGGSSGGTRVVMNSEVREIMEQNKLDAEGAYRVWKKKEELRKKYGKSDLL